MCILRDISARSEQCSRGFSRPFGQNYEKPRRRKNQSPRRSYQRHPGENQAKKIRF
jgi:hypothetical protein